MRRKVLTCQQLCLFRLRYRCLFHFCRGVYPTTDTSVWKHNSIGIQDETLASKEMNTHLGKEAARTPPSARLLGTVRVMQILSAMRIFSIWLPSELLSLSPANHALGPIISWHLELMVVCLSKLKQFLCCNWLSEPKPNVPDKPSLSLFRPPEPLRL